MLVRWSDVIADQKRWTELVCRYLDDWSPEPVDMPARRSRAFAALRQGLEGYVVENGRTTRATFRLALCLDIHRRFLHIHGRDTAEGPLELYTVCKRDPDLPSASWAGEPLVRRLDRCIVNYAADSSRPDPDPDVMTAAGTRDLPALVALAEQRRSLVTVLESDKDP